MILDKLFHGRFAENNKTAEAELWTLLVGKGLIKQDLTGAKLTEGDSDNLPKLPKLPEFDSKSPWYIQFMQSIGAWFASLFILGFTITFFGLLYDDLGTQFAFGIGIIYSLVAIGIYRSNSSSQLFANQMALSISLCGLLSLGYGLTGWFEPNHGIYWHFSFGLALLVHWLVIKHYSHQLMMSFGMLVCFAAMAYELGFLAYVAPLYCIFFCAIWLYEAKVGQYYSRLNALGYMIAVCLVLIQIPLLMQHGDFQHIVELPIIAPWSNVASVVTAFCIGAVAINHILGSIHISWRSRIGLFCLIGLVLSAALSLVMTGLITALLILLMGFYLGERLLFALGVLGILSFIGWYYYSLQLPLLDKSLWLVALGSMLLLAKVLMIKFIPTSQVQTTPN
ncbi:DUF4401 domain-containing protein [Shewanella pneumatophori]|uniref:DUF4401 domain-containing protein n=1 Tax=Shewanella pneumatophori TaxID=314092 RepID=A0A9X1ZCX3_9GAMM|nr:DUF4401 domain-containing protein [Shewanella pneumatophori]MCL1137065.1 DUF4401 domain-containing protein [Shewanella pneumatophori]